MFLMFLTADLLDVLLLFRCKAIEITEISKMEVRKIVSHATLSSISVITVSLIKLCVLICGPLKQCLSHKIQKPRNFSSAKNRSLADLEEVWNGFL